MTCNRDGKPSLYLVPRVTLFVKVTKGAKDFLKDPEITLTTETPNKHPRGHKIRVTVAGKWQSDTLSSTDSPKTVKCPAQQLSSASERCSRKYGRKVLILYHNRVN